MRYNTFVRYKRMSGDGAIEVNGKEVIVYKKSEAIRVAFGAIGSALAQGREILRFSIDEIKSYNVINGVIRDELCITLFNSESVTISLKTDIKNDFFPMVEKAVTNNAHKKAFREKPDEKKTVIRIVESETPTKTGNIEKPKNGICPKCGQTLPEDSIYCQYCGFSLIAATPQTRTITENKQQVKRPAPAAAPVRPEPQTQYTVLAENTEKVLQGGLPILLEKTVLRKESDGKLSVVCSFRSIVDKTIQAMQIDVKCADIWREAVKPVEGHQYLDLNIRRDELFGENERIAIPDPNTRVVDVVVRKIMFSDGTLLQRDGENIKVSEPTPLVKTLGKELFEEYKTQTYSNARFVPVSLGQIWVCTCGAINREEESDCHLCGDSLASLTSHLDKDMLQKSVDEKKRIQREKEERERIAREEALRLQREKEERERREREKQLRIQREREAAEAAERKRIEEEKARIEAEAARIRAEQRKKRNKKIAIISAAAAACLLLGYLIGWQIIPSVKYSKAEKAYAAGDFELAYNQFSSIPGYKDSQDRAIKMRYAQAEEALKNREYDIAYQCFSEIAEYSDSETQAKEALYQKAEALKNEKKFSEAKEIFLQLKLYKNSPILADKCTKAQKYYDAVSLFESGEYNEAAEAFAVAFYEDSKDRAKVSYYLYAKELIEEGKLHEAYLILSKKVNIGTTFYEDSVELANQVEYQYASECFEAKDYKEALTSFYNVIDYEDSEQRYYEAKYLYGVQAMETKDYAAAVHAFSTLKTPYKDSAKLLKEAQYQNALLFMKSKEYAKAVKLFEELGNYNDSAKQLKEAKYLNALSLVKDKKYTQAVPIFKELGNYSDSLEQWKSAMWSYVLAHKNNDDKTTYEYLTALKRYNYKDSKKYYEDLYTWRATAKFYTSYSSTTQINSVSRTEKQVCVKWTLSGGAPGEEIGVRFYNTLPGGVYYNYNSSSTALRDGDTASFTMNDFGTWAKPGIITAKLYNRSTSALIATATLTIY